MQDSRRQFLTAMAAGATGMLAGCGGTDTGTPTGDSTESATATATETETSTPTETPTETATETATETVTETTGTPTTEVVQPVSVGADGFQFSPETFEIAVGDTVEWQWDGNGHNVVPDTTPSGSDWSGTEGGAGTTYGMGHTHSYTFETAGTYSYYCAPHQGQGMTGSFTVTE